jgi:hypothetical protein
MISKQQGKRVLLAVGCVAVVLGGLAGGILFATAIPSTSVDGVNTPFPTLSPVELGSSDNSGSTGNRTPAPASAPTSTTNATPTLRPESSPTTPLPTPRFPSYVTVTGDTRQFNFTIQTIEPCGQRCRDVTANLRNTGDRVRNIRVVSRLYAGSAGDDEVWRGSEEYRTLRTNKTTAIKTRITIGYAEGIKLCGANRTTMRTTVSSTEYEQTFTTHPQIC